MQQNNVQFLPGTATNIFYDDCKSLWLTPHGFHNAASYSCFAQNFILVQLASYFAQHGLQVQYPQMTHGKCMTTISVSDAATASVNIVPG